MTKIKRLGFIGDIHAEDQLLNLAIQFIKKQQVDSIVSVGDIADGSGCINTCCTILQAEQVITVAGNHDKWLLENDLRDLPQATQLAELSRSSYLFLKSLPKTHCLETIAGSLLLCHGLGKDDMEGIMPSDHGDSPKQIPEFQALVDENRYHFILNGHTHFKMVRQIEPFIIINAGTLKWAHGAGFALIDFSQNYVQFYEFYDKGHSIEKAEYRELLT